MNSVHCWLLISPTIPTMAPMMARVRPRNQYSVRGRAVLVEAFLLGGVRAAVAEGALHGAAFALGAQALVGLVAVVPGQGPA